MTGAEAEQLGRRLEIHLRKNNFEACHIVLHEVEKERDRRYNGRLTLAETQLDMRWVNILENAGYLYVDQLEELSKKDIEKLCRKIPNLGPRAVTAIKLAIMMSKKYEPCKS